jgi:alanine dehydrogenase
MVIGVPKESHRHEHRVGLTPFAVARLVKEGHTIFVERGAGDAAHFTDEHFVESGAQIAYKSEEVYKRADLVCRVGLLSTEEIALLKRDLVICAFHHLAITPKDNIQSLSEHGATLIGYEIVRDAEGGLPILFPFSEMAGQMVVPLASYHLQTEAGGRGILLGNLPGVAPPTILILGAGTVGRATARQAVCTGSHVVVLDEDMGKLRDLNHELPGRVITLLATPDRLTQYTAIADVIVGAVLIPGARAPYLITEEMVKKMKRGSLILDIAIDQGGCAETSRPTTLTDPTYTVHGVIHYCVPNLTANIPRTASRALSNAALPYVSSLAARGLDDALREDPGLAAGVYMYRGRLVEHSIEGVEASSEPLQRILEED